MKKFEKLINLAGIMIKKEVKGMEKQLRQVERMRNA